MNAGPGLPLRPDPATIGSTAAAPGTAPGPTQPDRPPGPPPWLRQGVLLLAAGLLLVWPAFRNGYPLVFADTGTYLGQALLYYVGWDRPPFYSLFLLATHWRLTLWLPLVVQGVILAHLIGLALRVQGLGGPVPLMLVVLVLAAATPLPFVAAQLIPDWLTGVLVLSLWLLGFRARLLSRPERFWLLLLATFAVAAHQSHLPLGLGLALLGALLLWAGQGGLRAVRLPAARMLVPVLLGGLAMVTANFLAHNRLSLSPFGSVFLATRLIYDGPGRETLREACGAGTPWRICGVEARLPEGHNNFLWRSDSPLHHDLRGPKAWAPEAGAIVAATLHARPAEVAEAAFRNTLEQLGMVGAGDGLEPWPVTSGPELMIARFFPTELARYLGSMQQRGLLRPEVEAVFAPVHLASAIAGLAALLALCAMRVLPPWRRRRARLAGIALCAFVLAAIPANALITAGLSGPAPRYQARLAWLFVLAPALVAGPALVLSRSTGRAGGRAAAPSA